MYSAKEHVVKMVLHFLSSYCN